MPKKLCFLVCAIFFAFAVSAQADSPVTSGLTPKDFKILEKGEISNGQYLTAGIVGSIVGFGSGQAIEGRYLMPGMIFSIGEGTGLALMLISPIFSEQSAHDRQEYGDSEPMAVALMGLTIFSLFRIGDIIDVWLAPPLLNARYRRVKAKEQHASVSDLRVMPILLSDGHAGLGASLTF